MEYKMVDNKTVISQVQEFQLILHEIEAEGMNLPETFQVAWRNFKNYLKHKRKKLKLEDLIVRLRIEEDNRKSKKRSNKNSYEAKVNVIEDLKEKVSTSKGLKRKRLPRDTKARTKKAKTSASKKLAISTIKRDTRGMNVAVVQKKNKKNHP